MSFSAPAPLVISALMVLPLSLAGCAASTGRDIAEFDDGGGTTRPDGSPAEDAGVDSGVDAASDAPVAAQDAGDDALPPGTTAVMGLERYMTKIANGGTDRCTSAGGHDYCGGSCNGKCAGTTGESSYSLATGTSTPSLDGSSTVVDVSGASTDTLEWVKLDPKAAGTGPYANDTHFRWELDFYPTTVAAVQAYEFDLFFGSNGWWLMMGSQCDLATGNWNGWNQATGHWVASSIEGCGSLLHPNQWNHIVMSFHRDSGPVGSATRYYYDSLEVNGVSQTWGLGAFNGTNKGWGDVVGVQVQQDLTSAFTGTLSSYYDGFTLEVSP